MQVKSITVQDYSSGSAYQYPSNFNGAYSEIVAVNGAVGATAGAAASSSASTSSAQVRSQSTILSTITTAYTPASTQTYGDSPKTGYPWVPFSASTSTLLSSPSSTSTSYVLHPVKASVSAASISALQAQHYCLLLTLSFAIALMLI